jgi:hypothetical protein
MTHSISRLDRTWAGHWTTVIATALRTPEPELLRAKFREFMAAYPAHRLACTIDSKRCAWTPVAAAEREAHAARVISVSSEPLDPRPEEFARVLNQSAESIPSDLPFTLTIGPDYLVFGLSHLVGDALTTYTLSEALANADFSNLGPVDETLTVPQLLAATTSYATHRPNAWWRHATGRRAQRPLDVPDVSPDLTALPSSTRFAQSHLSTALTTAVLRWRDDNVPGLSLNAIIPAAFWKALRDEGICIARTRLDTLFDTRSLIAGSAHAFGNYAKALRLDVDLSQPATVQEAIRHAQDTARALPASVLGALAPSRGDGQYSPGPLVLTHNSLPPHPMTDRLPYMPGTPAWFTGTGFGPSLGSISLQSRRTGSGTDFVAVFDTRTAPEAAVNRALQKLQDMVSLLSAAQHI